MSKDNEGKFPGFGKQARGIKIASNNSQSTPKNGLQSIPLSELNESPLNARFYYPEEKVNKLAKSLESRGLLNPISVLIRDGKKIIVDGHFRYKAALANNWASIDAIVSDAQKSDLDIYSDSFSANEERNEQTLLDSAVIWKKLIRENNMTQVQIKQATGVSTGEISKTLKLSELPDVHLNSLSKKPTAIKVHAAYAIAQLFEKIGDTEAFSNLIDTIVEKDFTKSQIDNAIKKLDSDKTQARKKSEPVESLFDEEHKRYADFYQKGKKFNVNVEASNAEEARDIMKAVSALLQQIKKDKGC
jgi:ParB family chromosome partitioning protein